jgi:hypothetical protein
MTMAASMRPTSTDEQGRFTIDNLSPGAYMIYSSVPGYVAAPDDNESREQKYYRPGDSATIRMIKGGVITGAVTSMTGEPLIGIRVTPIRLRDLKNHPVSPSAFDLQKEYRTDDRGIYRIYGLQPGTYAVFAGGKGLIPFLVGAYDSDAPTFYPSATRDTAGEVTVHSGEEIASVDIKYRDYAGRAVSGSVSGAVASPAMNIVIITLTEVKSRTLQGFAAAPVTKDSKAYQLDGVPDGEYLAAATSSDYASGSAPRRVTVKGADVTGVDLVLVPYASIEGLVALEPLPQAQRKGGCQPRQNSPIQETILLTRADAVETPTAPKSDKTDADATTPTQAAPREKPFNLNPLPADATPNAKGEFKLPHLEPGRHRVLVRFPSDEWFLRSMKLPAQPPSNQLRDAGATGITLKSGEHQGGLTVTLAEGAAAVRGRVAAASKETPLPARLQVHLVPAEPEAADDVVRYYETELKGDGGFEFKNVAPGKYLVITRHINDDGPVDETPRPAAWDKDKRAHLRQRAIGAENLVELQPCQRVNEYSFKYPPGAKQKPDGR